MQLGTGGSHTPWSLQVVSIDVAVLFSRWPGGQVTLTTDHSPVSIDPLTVRNSNGAQVMATTRNKRHVD